MLIFDRFLVLLRRSLLISVTIVLGLVIYMKFFMYNISNEIVLIEKKIDELKEAKHTLNVELTYLTSTERLLVLIEKNPDVLMGKDILKPDQLKTKEDFRKISFAKIKNNPYGLNDYAKNDMNKIKVN